MKAILCRHLGRLALASALVAASSGVLLAPLAHAQSTGALPTPSAEVRARLAALKPKDFPTRPIELTVAYGAGGGMDVHTRLLAKYLTAYTDQSFLVINKAGAAGLIGHTYIATQVRPDGYVVGVLSSNFWADSIQRAEGKWTYRDVDPLAFYNFEPLGWVVLSSGPHKDRTLNDLVALARAKPGEIRGAMSDGSPTSYLMGQVEKVSGARFTRVAYQGGKQALNDLAGGHIDVSFGYLGEYRSLMLDGRVRPLAFTASKRTSVLPDVPTFNELLGADDIVWDAFRFVAVPKGLPADRKAWLEAAMTAAIADPNLAKEVAVLGGSVDPSLDTAARLTEEIERRVNRERVYYDTKQLLNR